MIHPLIVILGPTASGKSALAVRLARRFGGEVVSADSRQVYRGMDLGSGKVPRDRPNTNQIGTNGKRIFGANSMRFAYHSSGIRHHMLDIADPRRTFTVAEYRRHALRALAGIWKNGNIPILCGGTGLYIRAVVDGTVFPAVKPNAKLRHKLDKLTNEQLFNKLQKLDPNRAATIDPKNPHRLIRAIEIAAALGAVPPPAAHPLDANMLFIGITIQKPKLERHIRNRLKVRLRRGMVAEVRKLHAGGISWRRLEGFGLEYRQVARFLQSAITRAEMEAGIIRESLRYAKRQMTWFKRNHRIHWVSSPRAAERLANELLQQ
ncbi:MAG: tRNA (adenosine(37)-N6)-dimethylallyltransferase MiaA [bacterium]|nr:tRNA (adenosine(37)-N6)-dimethylallyltransferase MiaA [bacterium]